MAFRDIYRSLTDPEKDELEGFVRDITSRYVDAEESFLKLAFQMGPQQDMTERDAVQYIRYLADLRLSNLGLTDIYGVSENPLDWMDWMLSGRKHTNFFENKVTSYDHNGLVGEIDYSRYIGLLEDRTFG